MNFKISCTVPDIGEAEANNVAYAIKTGWISSKGQFVTEFENNFASFCGSKYGISTSSGTCALHLALAALGIGNGDEVIVPDLTFVATANAVKHIGAKPIFVDVDRSYWCLDPNAIPSRITNKTKAIIPVHLYGHPCRMDIISEIAEKNGLYIIEDAAQAHGAEFRGKRVGSLGTVSCFSFFANKIITTGEGGMCLTNDPDLAEKMRLLNNHGMRPERRYWHEVVGYSFRMTNLQAGIGLAQLEKLDSFIEKKRKIAFMYASRLRELEDEGLIKLQCEAPWAKSIYWVYCLLVNNSSAITRDILAAELGKRGIETRRFFHPMHSLPPYFTSEKFVVSEYLSEVGINLPSSTKMEMSDVDFIVDEVYSVFKHK